MIATPIKTFRMVYPYGMLPRPFSRTWKISGIMIAELSRNVTFSWKFALVVALQPTTRQRMNDRLRGR